MRFELSVANCWRPQLLRFVQQESKSGNKPAGPAKDKTEQSFVDRIERIALRLQCVVARLKFAPP